MAKSNLEVMRKGPVEEHAPPVVEGPAERVPLRRRQCRKHLRDRVAEEFREITNGFIAKAREGSVQHMKLALELMEPVKRAAPVKEEKDEARLLMEELGLE